MFCHKTHNVSPSIRVLRHYARDLSAVSAFSVRFVKILAGFAALIKVTSGCTFLCPRDKDGGDFVFLCVCARMCVSQTHMHSLLPFYSVELTAGSACSVLGV